MVVANLIANLENSHVLLALVQEGRFSADQCIDLAKALHGSEVCELDICRHQVDVPEDKQDMEVDDTVHCDVGQVWQIEHETSHDVKHDAQLCGSILRDQVDEDICKLSHGGVLQGEVLKQH